MTPQQELEFEQDQLEISVDQFIKEVGTKKFHMPLIDLDHYSTLFRQHLTAIDFARIKIKNCIANKN